MKNIKKIPIVSKAFFIPAFLAVVACSYLIASRPFEFLIYAPIAILAFIVSKNIVSGLYIIALLPVVGELVRLPLLLDKGVLISDLAIGVLVSIWLWQKLSKRETILKNAYLLPLFFFVVAGVFSLLQSLLFLKPVEVVSGSFYLIRFIEYTMLAIVAADSVKSAKQSRRLFIVIIFSALLIAMAGFIQLIIYPDLGKLTEFGWDPHRYRLVSTWLDPNFVGGLMALMISVLTGIAIYTKDAKNKLKLGLLILVLAIALFLTYSRSGYLALTLSILVIGALKSRKLLFTVIIIGLITLPLVPRAQERVFDLVRSAQSFIFNTAENPDATARLRIKSWEQTLQLIQKYPWFGVGYNNLSFIKLNEGFVNKTDVHSASGSDSSILTVMATTGIAGLVAFTWLYWAVLTSAFKNWRHAVLLSPDRHFEKVPARKKRFLWTLEEHKGFALGLFAGVIGLAGHSFFVNSLLFPQIMVFVWLLAGLNSRTRA